jgi:hypothetical protein
MDDWACVDPQKGHAPDRQDRSPDPFLAEFRTALAGTDIHERVRAAAMRAARTIGVEERLVARLPSPADERNRD